MVPVVCVNQESANVWRRKEELFTPLLKDQRLLHSSLHAVVSKSSNVFNTRGIRFVGVLVFFCIVPGLILRFRGGA